MSHLELHGFSASLMKVACSRASPQLSQRTVTLSEPGSTVLEGSYSTMKDSAFHSMKSIYSSIVEQVLSDSEAAKSLDKGSLDEFRKRHGTNPFACRYRECDRSFFRIQTVRNTQLS